MNIRKISWTYRSAKHSGWRLDARSHGKGQKQFKTKREAELARDAIIRGYEQETYGVVQEITFEKFLELYKERRPWRTESYRERVFRSLAHLPFVKQGMGSVGRPEIEAWLGTRQGKAASTIRQDVAAIHDCFRWAVKLGYLRKNPCEGIERPSLAVKQDDPQRYFSKEDFGKLITKAGRDASLYRFAAWTGLRVFELLALEWPDVEGDFVKVRRGKGRKQRIVPLLPEAKAALEAAKKLRKLGEKQERVFWWMYDRFCTLKRFKRRLKWAGLPESYRFHDLRHTFGSWAASSGVDIRVIGDCMGHTHTTTTKLYAHLHPDYVRRELVAKMAGRNPVDVRRKLSKQQR